MFIYIKYTIPEPFCQFTEREKNTPQQGVEFMQNNNDYNL